MQPTTSALRPSREGLTNLVLGMSALGIILSDLDAPHAGRAWIALVLVVALVARVERL